MWSFYADIQLAHQPPVQQERFRLRSNRRCGYVNMPSSGSTAARAGHDTLRHPPRRIFNPAGCASLGNNPLNPSPALYFQDYYTPELYSSEAYTNDFLIRGALPLRPMGIIPWPQLIRATVPISTRPDPAGGYTTGLGDMNVFDIFLLKTEGTQLGVGPLLTMPTASADELGTGKWQAGLAAVAVHSTPQRILAGLVQWETSFAGDDDRADVDTLTVQPLFIYNLPKGWYLRSTGIWTFDLENDHYYIPVGLGAGKVWKSGNTIMNAFVEPQWTVAHDGDGLPKFTLFAGLNLTFTK